MPYYLVIAHVSDTGALSIKGFEEHELDGARMYCNRLEEQQIFNEILMFYHDFWGDYKLMRRYI